MFKIKKKAQITSLELVLTLVAFFIIFLFVISLWNKYTVRLDDNVKSEEQHLLAFQIVDILGQSRGTPDNWEDDPNNVRVIGLQKNPGSLDEDKITEFVSLSYDKVKKLFNIGRYEFFFRMVHNGTTATSSGGAMLLPPIAYLAVSEVHALNYLNNITDVWDFYWCSTNSVPANNARFVYQIEDPKECLGDAIENRASYNSMLAEDIAIAESDFGNPPVLGSQHKTWLQEWVQDGGSYLTDEDGDHVCMFDMTCTSAEGLVGRVLSLAYIDNTTHFIGELITFVETPMAIEENPGDLPLTIVIEDKKAKDDLGKDLGLFSYWDYGSGRVFYVADLEVIGNPLGFDYVRRDPLPLKLGKPPENATTVVSVRRLLTYGNAPISLQMMLWK